LIVEDQPTMRKMLRQFLESLLPQCVCMEASNGAQALESLAQRQPDLILMDIGLPDADGIELTRQINATHPNSRVIVVSMNRGDMYAKKATDAGAVAFVAKDRIVTDLPPLLREVMK